MGRFLGIDVGSSYIKAAILDPDRPALVRTARVRFPPFENGLPPAWREVDPEAVLASVEELAQRLTAGARCDGVVLCGQMHGFVLVNARGEALSNYVSWLDQRVSPAEFAELAALVNEQERRAIGNEFRPAIALALLWWLQRHGALPASATPVSIADFVAARLCGAAPVMEPTQAAAFGALRLDTLAWHEEVIGKAGLEGLGWPAVRPPGSLVGRCQGAPCYAAAGDQQCALAGALLAQRELSLNVGTGSQVAMLADTISPDRQTRPYFDGRLLHTITHIPAGRALSALVALCTEIGGTAEDEAWRYIERALAATPETDVRAAVSFFPGPCGNRGFLQNLHEGNLRIGPVFRAVLESMARNFENCARALDPARTAVRIVFSGGVARRLDLLRELTGRALPLPARLSPHPEDTLFGLMVLASAYSGRRPVSSDPEYWL